MRDQATCRMQGPGRRGQRPGPIARFRDDESGAMIIFGLVFFIIILMFTGISIDVARHEALRSKLQATLDASVLAGAAVNKTNDERKAIVMDYMTKAGLGSYVTDVQATGDAYHPQISATASAPMSPIFMQLDGINKMTVPAASKAAQTIGKLEISLVLDVSNSMNDNDKIGKLKTAAKDFVAQMFKASVPGMLSISVVPYSTQVTAGPTLFSYFQVTAQTAQPYSYCLAFSGNDFDTTAMPATEKYAQAGNFDAWYVSTAIDTSPLPSYSDMYTYWGYLKSSYMTNTDTFGGLRACSKWPSRYILPFSTDKTTIDNMIDGLVANGNTSIDVGMKWGAGLLDPSTQRIYTGLTGISAADQIRPAAYTDKDTMKVVVLMTDGANFTRPDLTSKYDSGPSIVWASKTDPNAFSIKGKSPYSNATAWYWNTDKSWHNAPIGTTAQTQPDPLTWQEVWERMSVRYFTYDLVAPSQGWNAVTPYLDAILQWTPDVGLTTAGTQDNNLKNICDAAKANGVTVYTIGFMAAQDGKDALQDCASAPADYYDVQSLDISTAFNSIANAITRLRLTQ